MAPPIKNCLAQVLMTIILSQNLISATLFTQVYWLWPGFMSMDMDILPGLQTSILWPVKQRALIKFSQHSRRLRRER